MSDTGEKEALPLIIHHRKLRARKELLGFQYWDLAAKAGKSQQALADVLAGRGTVNLQTLAAVAGALGMGVVIDFVPLEDKPVDLAAELKARLMLAGSLPTDRPAPCTRA